MLWSRKQKNERWFFKMKKEIEKKNNIEPKKEGEMKEIFWNKKRVIILIIVVTLFQLIISFAGAFRWNFGAAIFWLAVLFVGLPLGIIMFFGGLCGYPIGWIFDLFSGGGHGGGKK